MSDGVQIAYCVEGEGPPLLLCPYFLESFSDDDDGFGEWPQLFASMTAGRQVVRYCMRGSALSQREGAEISQEGFYRDIEACCMRLDIQRTSES
jgi:hypothetical protein